MQIPVAPTPVERELSIEEVLNRRSDLSTFIVHLTRDHGDGETAKTRLLSIIAERRLRAGATPRGWAASVRRPPAYVDLCLTDEQLATQVAISFSETPLEHIYSLYANIANRQVHLSPYGLAITKMVARRAGVNPVWYVDLTPAVPEHPMRIRNALNHLVVKATAEGWFGEIRDLFQCVEGMQTRRDNQGNITTQVEFWWEREWRHVYDMGLALIWDKIIWLCPEPEIPEITNAVNGGNAATPVHCIDPGWSLERIVGHLAGFSAGDMSPFAAR
jgi:hypothetical protein